MTPYLKDPAAIYQASFQTVRAVANLDGVPDDVAAIVVRMIHACGMPDIVRDLRFSLGVARAAREALEEGAPILVDCAMVAVGVVQRHLPTGCRVVCTLDDSRTAGLAAEMATTRSAAAVELWRPHLDGAVVAIGNAPTALFRMLELVEAGAPQPAAVIGLPVGFVGAAESKAALAGNDLGLEYLTLLGRRGGSAMAAAAVNALLVEEPA
jgi:precorrin-8X/cobalt-precorrin-8 methylmutase